MSERAKPRWFGILRALLAVVPLAWIFTKLDGPRLLERLGDLSWWVLGVSVVAPLLAMGIASLRWRVLLGGYGANSPPRVRTLFRHVLVGAYFNLLPGAVAGDALRAF